ncbi:SemiSWEET family sugar transporter [Aquimarina muelleri]|uniref:MtN3 and saliva related transmembrane protein n=1 Tax=Aquimarina muelleri TaxID=279356 RepID=A0A918N403_9FLAO|nr:SemiSWEET transporter [Aquimarina muelleri]MCX2762706.1 SemiSWEET transporter [Aquimarina muelleri]GGX18472.1 hypothetical protein GCM10007384_19770 [Aquimarina muelleri]
MVDLVEIIGFVAATLTTIAFLPQVYKTWKTKSTEGLSSSMLFALLFGMLGWLIYGLLIYSLPIIFANTITLVSMFVLVYFKYRYKK